ncbi:MAG TPA: Flp family type IVb pilin [Acidocella sp.]|nr:Flp family type IVb pilin [Acidocella sp.]
MKALSVPVYFWFKLGRRVILETKVLILREYSMFLLRSRLWRDRRAVTAVEYAIIAGIIVTALVISVSAIGPALNPTFNTISSEL